MGTYTKRNKLPCPGEELVEPAGVIWISAIQYDSHQSHEQFKLCMHVCNFFLHCFKFCFVKQDLYVVQTCLELTSSYLLSAENTGVYNTPCYQILSFFFLNQVSQLHQPYLVPMLLGTYTQHFHYCRNACIMLSNDLLNE